MRGPLVVKPVVLEGRFVRLEPLRSGHLAALCEVGLDPELWRWTVTRIRTNEDMLDYIATAIELQEQGSALPFVTIDRSSNTLVGSTRYGNIDKANRRLEIGWTWLAKRWQRTPINTEAKYLMLKHAFEVLGCVRVEFKTDSLNEKSRRALLRIGAKEEGTFRNHMIVSDGRLRHSVWFSIIDSEWPVVKIDLEQRLGY
jgi:RimJ/RimL family protein N-acetyltransferase